MPVTLPATGTGTATPIVSTDNVTADSSQVQNMQVVTVAAGVMTRATLGTQYTEDGALGTATGTAILLRGSAALPSAVGTDGDAIVAWGTKNGTQLIAALPHLGLVADAYTLTSKTAQYTSTQTTAVLWTPTSGKKLVITQVQIQIGGTTAGTLQLYFAAASGAYSRGSTLAIFDGEFAPSATSKPGVVMNGPWIASAVDHRLHVTDSAAINPLTITVWGYEI